MKDSREPSRLIDACLAMLGELQELMVESKTYVCEHEQDRADAAARLSRIEESLLTARAVAWVDLWRRNRREERTRKQIGDVT